MFWGKWITLKSDTGKDFMSFMSLKEAKQTEHQKSWPKYYPSEKNMKVCSCEKCH
jgi:hypothetical protein